MQTSQYESMMATHTNPPMAGEKQPQLAGLGAHHRALGNTRAITGASAAGLAAILFYKEYKENADAMRYARVILAMVGGYALSYSMR
tara:strand:- start:1520 stop:1780 length:261 start_codon:yes stop_codon:yes gene_type:complete